MIKRIFLLICLATLLLTSGCSNKNSINMNQKIKEDIQKEENFKNELLSEGLVKRLDNTIKSGDGEITIKDIIFDTNFVIVTYEVSKQLSSLNMKLLGDSNEIKITNNFTSFRKSNTSLNFQTSPSFNTVPIPHNLKLIDQKIKLEIEINNNFNYIIIDFPGDKIALLTKELLFNNKGEQVVDSKQAIARVRVGINSLEIESKGFCKELVVLDLKNKRLLDRTSFIYSGEDGIEYFEPIPIHRKEIDIKLVYSDKVIFINY